MAAIRIEGAKAIRSSFLARLCRPYIDPSIKSSSLLNRLIYGHRLDQVMPGQPSSLPGLLNLLAAVGTDLSGLDVFADMSASLEPSGAGEETIEGSLRVPSAEDVDIVLTCKEQPRYYLKSSTDVGNGEGNAAIQARIRNVFGGAETADMSATMGTRTRRAFHASLAWPIFALPDHTMSLSAFAQDRDLTGYASATEGARGARWSMRLNAGASGVHELAYDLMHRHLARLHPTTSLSMRHLAGHSVKSSFSHTFTLDTRDDFSMATQGSLFKTVLEYAGLGGDARHIKTEVQTQFSRCFGDEATFAASFAGRAGLLTTLNGRAPAFSDRFQLGGPTSLRMFRYNSLGPKDGLDSLGGDAFFALGSSLISPLWPGKAHWPLKWHAFLNAGQLIQLDHHHSSMGAWARQNSSLMWNELLSKPSSSAGVGLMLRQGGLRAEINVGVPLTMRKGDGARKGIQLGIGIDFL